jgi:3-hydroxyisobutyrate dehydrogenase-like beta-hydroxyacid dehydrogenase
LPGPGGHKLTVWNQSAEKAAPLAAAGASVDAEQLAAMLKANGADSMFGMINGAQVCRKAGVPMQIYADQIPATLKLVHDCHKLFADIVPQQDYDNPEASMAVYALAQEDALKTFKRLGAPAQLIQMIYDHTHAALADGMGDKQLTALTEPWRGDSPATIGPSVTGRGRCWPAAL